MAAKEKKNTARAGALLLAAALVTTVLTSGTLAKYTETRSEERRVGKEGRSRWSPYH